MRRALIVLLLLCSAFATQSALAEPVPALPEGMDLTKVFSPGSRWVYHYTRTAPEGHPDESILRDHFLIWTAEAPPADDGAGNTTITLKEEGGPDDHASRTVTWRINAAGCWSMVHKKDKAGPPMCPNTAIKDIEIMLPGDLILADLFGMENDTHAALLSARIGLASYSVTRPGDIIETWTLEGYSGNALEVGAHDLKPTRCDWDESLRDLPQDKPTTLTLGPKKNPLTVEVDPVNSTLILSRKGAVIGQMCTPNVNEFDGDNGVTLKSIKGWVAPDGAAYIALHASFYWDGGEGSHEDKILLLRVKGSSVSEVQSFDAASYSSPDNDKISFPGPMLMQSGSECVMEFWLNDKRPAIPTRTVASFPLSGAWPLVQSRGSLTPTADTFTLLKDFPLSSCAPPPAE